MGAVLTPAARPSYAELLVRDGAPPGSSWGLWGPDDQIGALNLITAEHVTRATTLVTRGAVFALNWPLERPDPPLFGRGPIEHVKVDDGFGMDDHFNKFFPHGSTHWDSMAHFRHPQHGYYGGRTAAQLKGSEAQGSIAEWAKHGVVARFVLADVDAWRAAEGRPIDHASSERITIGDVTETLAAQGSQAQEGDILLLRAGWVNWYEGLGSEHRAGLAAEPWEARAPGLSANESTLAWLWDTGIVAIGSDLPAVEPLPFDPRSHCLHACALALLGINLGEMFALDALAEDCSADGRYTGLLMSAPMNFTGATGSPANALALK